MFGAFYLRKYGVCPYQRYIINATKSYQGIISAVCVKKLVFKIILGNTCVGGENLVPIAVPDRNPAILTISSVEIFCFQSCFIRNRQIQAYDIYSY